MLADAMTSYPGVGDFNTRVCAFKDLELFGPSNKSLIFHLVTIATHINIIKLATPFLALTLKQK